MYRALARFAQRRQAMLQPGRFVAAAGERGATPTPTGVGGALGPAVGEDDERGARRAAGGDARPEADAVLLGRAQDDVVHLARAAGRVDDQVDQRLRARRSRRRPGTSRSPMCELTASVSDVIEQLLGQAADRADRELAVDQQERILRTRRGSGGAETSRPSPQREQTRDAGWMSAACGWRPQCPQKWTSGRARLRGPEGRRDGGVRSRGFHLTAVIRLCDVVFSRSGHPARPAIEYV